VDKKNFVGLPIPAAAGLIAAIVHFSPAPLSSRGGYEITLYGGLLMCLTAALGALMVSNLRYTSFKAVGATRRSTTKGIIVVAAVGMLVWLYSRYILLGFVTVYVLHGIVFRLGALLRWRRSVKSQA
jgi:CDP-diacylglycerol--serine O-phosphatidyltransferase